MNNLTIEQLRKNKLMQEELDRQVRVAKHLTLMKDANDNTIQVRGTVDRVRCERCLQPRWDDGTPCKFPVVIEAVKGAIKRVPCGGRAVVTLATGSEEPTL